MGFLRTLLKTQKNPNRAERVGFREPWFVLHGVGCPSVEAALTSLHHDGLADLYRSPTARDSVEPSLVLLVSADDECFVVAR